MKKTHLILLLGIIGSAYCSCNLEPVEGFNDKDLLGDWTLLAHTDIKDPKFPNLLCELMYGFKEGPKYTLTGTGIDIQTNQKIANWTETGVLKDKPGNFFFSSKNFGEYILTVIGKTTKGVVLYSCEFPFRGRRYAWIFYRDHNANLETLPVDEKTEIIKSLSDNGIELSSMEIHDNSKC